MRGYVFLVIAIACEVIGSTALKASDGFTRPVPTIVVAIGYAAAFYFLSLTLRTLPLSTAYAIWSGLGTAAIAVLGFTVLREPINLATVAGIVLIIAGVVVLQLSGSTH